MWPLKWKSVINVFAKQWWLSWCILKKSYSYIFGLTECSPVNSIISRLEKEKKEMKNNKKGDAFEQKKDTVSKPNS